MTNTLLAGTIYLWTRNYYSLTILIFPFPRITSSRMITCTVLFAFFIIRLVFKVTYNFLNLNSLLVPSCFIFSATCIFIAFMLALIMGLYYVPSFSIIPFTAIYTLPNLFIWMLSYVYTPLSDPVEDAQFENFNDISRENIFRDSKFIFGVEQYTLPTVQI